LEGSGRVTWASGVTTAGWRQNDGNPFVNRELRLKIVPL